MALISIKMPDLLSGISFSQTNSYMLGHVCTYNTYSKKIKEDKEETLQVNLKLVFSGLKYMY